MNKQQWIKSQSEALNVTNPNDLWSYLFTTQVEVVNTVPRLDVPKLIDIREAFTLIHDNEKLPISESLTYRQGLIPALQSGDVGFIQDNITTLVAGGIMSPETAQALGALMAETEPDPNWQPTVKVPMYVAAGFDSLSLQDTIDALL
jgi:hypothetical protein